MDFGLRIAVADIGLRCRSLSKQRYGSREPTAIEKQQCGSRDPMAIEKQHDSREPTARRAVGPIAARLPSNDSPQVVNLRLIPAATLSSSF